MIYYPPEMGVSYLYIYSPLCWVLCVLQLSVPALPKGWPVRVARMHRINHFPIDHNRFTITWVNLLATYSDVFLCLLLFFPLIVHVCAYFFFVCRCSEQMCIWTYLKQEPLTPAERLIMTLQHHRGCLPCQSLYR